MNKQPLYIRPSQFEVLEDRIAPATIIVTNLNDSGAGSLRDAVDQANMGAGTDTIKFAKSAQGTIVLGSDIDITDSLVIAGPGASKVSISGNNTSRAFNIDDGTADLISVSISGLRFVNGNDSVGGAILSNENLTLNKTEFLFNSSAGRGGAIASTAGDTIIQSSKFTNNTATNEGGAISLYTAGVGRVVGSIISGNKAGGTGGAGIYMLGGNNGGNFYVEKSTVSNNTSGGNGGGILVDTDDGTLTVVGSKVTGNSASTGGGLYFDDGKLVVQSSTFSYNSATGRGGGLAAQFVVSVAVSGSTFSFNKADGSGGGLYLAGSNDGSTITSSKILSNISGGSGGGVFSKEETLNVTSSLISGNSAAVDGGGVRAESGGTVDFAKVKLINNSAMSHGGGLSTAGTMADAVNIDIESSLFQGNRAAAGGGAYTVGDGAITLAKSKVQNNTATSSDGGGMYLRTTTTLDIISSIFSGNSANDDAGGLALGLAGTFTITKSKFLKNAALGDDGGGIAQFDGALTLSGCTITGNSAVGAGGGVYRSNQTITVENSKISGNTAPTGPDLYQPI